MAIKIPEERESRLIMALADGFQSVMLSNGFVTLPSLNWVAELQPLLSDDDRNMLDRYCGEPGLQRFIFAEMGAAAHKISDGSVKTSQALTEREPFRNTISYARSLVASLKRLPQRYLVTVALPIEFSDTLIGEIDPEITLKGDIKVGFTVKS